MNQSSRKEVIIVMMILRVVINKIIIRLAFINKSLINYYNEMIKNLINFISSIHLM